MPSNTKINKKLEKSQNNYSTRFFSKTCDVDEQWKIRTQKIDFQNEEVKHVNNEEKNILQKLDHMIPFEKSTFSHQKLNQSISRAICKPLKNMDVKSNSNDKERERLANLNSNFEVKKDNSIDTNRKVKRTQRTFSTNQKSNKNHKKKTLKGI